MSAPVDVLREYARDTGAFRVNNAGATRLAAAVAELLAQRDMMANALATYRKAGVGNSTDFYLQMEASTLAAVALARVAGAA